MGIPVLYTVEEIAGMMSVTPRTIRNYLRQGVLKGRKMGGQWRFTQADVEDFMDGGKVIEDMKEQQNQEIQSFLQGQGEEGQGDIFGCMVLRLCASVEEARRRADRVCEFAGMYKGVPPFRFSYTYEKEEQTARYVVFGDPATISAALDLLRG